MRLKNIRTKDTEAVCPKCAAAGYERSYSDTLDFRNLVLDVEGLHQQWCEVCCVGWETSEQADHNLSKVKETYASARDRLRVRDGLLTGDQIQSIRKKLCLTQKDAASLFGGGINAFNKYESGEVLQSYAMDRLIRLVGFFGEAAVQYLRSPDKSTLRSLTEGVPTARHAGNGQLEPKLAESLVKNIAMMSSYRLLDGFRTTKEYPVMVKPYSGEDEINRLRSNNGRAAMATASAVYSECLLRQSAELQNITWASRGKEIA